jgi:hypothetical protein
MVYKVCPQCERSLIRSKWEKDFGICEACLDAEVDEMRKADLEDCIDEWGV